MFPQEAKTITANIGSLVDQLEQIEEGEGFNLDPELEDEELEEEPGEDLAAIFAALEEGEELTPDQVVGLEQAVAGTELGADLVDRVKAGETLSAEDLALLKAIVDAGSGAAEEVAEGEAVAKSIISRSLEGLSRQDAVPLLSGIAGLNRAGRLVTKRFPDWETARKDTSPDPDVARLFGEGSVQKALPGSLQPESGRLGSQLEDLESDVLERAVLKMETGEPLTEEEMAEAMAANLKGQPFAPMGGMTLSGTAQAHKSLIPLNPRRPVESLQETMGEVRRMIAGEREDIVLNRQGRGGKRKDLVRKSLGAAVNMLLGQRQ